MLSVRFQVKPGTRAWFRFGFWALFAWSFVVSGYALHACLAARASRRSSAPPSGLTDALTGLPNRRGLIAELRRYEGGAAGLGKGSWLVDVDLLNLDKVNFEFGPAVGDAALRGIADLLQGLVPGDGLVGRLEGDEFLIVLPFAEREDAEALSQAVREAVDEYGLDRPGGVELGFLKAAVNFAAYRPELLTLHETVEAAKASTNEWRLAGGEEGARVLYYHVPRVTLGAFAVHRWEDLGSEDQERFKTWKLDLGEEQTKRMASEIVQLMDQKAEAGWADFVTALPSSGGKAERRYHGGRLLAQAVARQAGLPYRDVLSGLPAGSDRRSVEPSVDAFIQHGEGVLLVVDVIGSGITERRCVRSLGAAGAHVQVIAWAAY
jgi:diguanylate cyclase (GGDEF)-like protein